MVWNVWLTYRLTQPVSNTPAANEDVEITQETLTDYTSDLTAVVEQMRPSIVTVITDGEDSRTASGVIFAAENGVSYIFTTSEAVAGQTDALIYFDSSAEIRAEIIGFDYGTGLGLLKAETEFDTAAPVHGDSDLLEQGEYVIALGGRRKNTGTNMVSFGIVSEPGFRRLGSVNWLANIIETDAEVNENNYGGPLLDVGGELVGMLLGRSSGSTGYAVSINEMEYVFDELKRDRIVSRGSLGIICRNISDLKTYEKNMNDLSLDLTDGLFITEVARNGAADGFLEIHDVITQINGVQIRNATELRRLLYEHQTEDVLTITYIRNGEQAEVQVGLK